MRGAQLREEALHEVVEEVLIAVLVGALLQILLCHDIVVGMISPPCKLLALLGYTGLFFALRSVSGQPPLYSPTGRRVFASEYGR
jgi:hypothetical protein